MLGRINPQIVNRHEIFWQYNEVKVKATFVEVFSLCLSISLRYILVTDGAKVQPIAYRLGPRPRPKSVTNSSTLPITIA